ncbi:MAG: hypothetical protein ACHQXK_02025 [Methanosarcina thermophila]|uniref:hypothetical protein n=1 Tax=Methanosarcina thermophila TaxID=2210 RepID=UPI00064ECFDA|nr:hypothetical protein [Methanosarcina thermophila]ALK05832.1 MAG: hypothetical protein AAY43_09180 [Methanosarcina sp. 795]NLU57684.1 hypothetical protein [Methanosarcina thermophila]HOQ64843.1 hypothetical protein [Methanosarcina thermophila]HPZ18777.1 hypothetical protein [Methanosarcina thermophila]
MHPASLFTKSFEKRFWSASLLKKELERKLFRKKFDHKPFQKRLERKPQATAWLSGATLGDKPAQRFQLNGLESTAWLNLYSYIQIYWLEF